MKLTLTNTGSAAVPIASAKGWVETLDPNTPMTIDKDEKDQVWIIGDKPGFAEALKTFAAALQKFITQWKDKELQAGQADPVIRVTIENNGEKSVRIIPGDPTKTVPDAVPGQAIDVEAQGYIELRELGA